MEVELTYCECCPWIGMVVYEVSSSKALGISKAVSRSLERVQNAAHKESNLRISVCEYDAPTTRLESAAFEETLLELLGLLRQKGEVLLLQMISWGLR